MKGVVNLTAYTKQGQYFVNMWNVVINTFFARVQNCWLCCFKINNTTGSKSNHCNPFKSLKFQLGLLICCCNQMLLYIYFISIILFSIVRHHVLELTDSIDTLGTVRWQLVLCLLATCIVVFLALVKGIKSSGKVRLAHYF